jgi:hypothetical protein
VVVTLGEFCYDSNGSTGAQRTISSMTMSTDPTTAGMSTIKPPRQSSGTTERLQKELL